MLSSLAAKELQFGRVHALLRELCGYDELLVETDDTRTALRLLDRLLVGGEGTWPPPGAAAAMTAPERDRVLAEVWIRAFGPRVAMSHLKDIAGADATYLGGGTLPLPAILDAFDALPQPIIHCFEYGGGDDPDGRNAASLAYLKARGE